MIYQLFPIAWSLFIHFIFSQPHSPFCEYIAGSPDGKSVVKMFYFDGEQLPENGRIKPSYDPGFGMI